MLTPVPSCPFSSQRIALLRSQLQELADLLPADFEDNESDDETAADMDLLIKHGVIPPRKDVKGKGKMKMPYRPEQLTKSGHVVFVDDVEANPLAGDAQGEDADAEDPADVAEDPQDDLGWIDASDPSGKLARRQRRKEQRARDEAPVDLDRLAEEQERLDVELEQAAAAHRQRLLAELAGRLRRVENLEEIARHMELQKKMMGKGAVQRVERRSRGNGDVGGAEVHPEDEMEDDRFAETGGKLGWKTKVVKWKAERRR